MIQFVLYFQMLYSCVISTVLFYQCTYQSEQCCTPDQFFSDNFEPFNAFQILEILTKHESKTKLFGELMWHESLKDFEEDINT